MDEIVADDGAARADEIAFLRSRGEVSIAATLRGMARSGDGRLALVEIKAVDVAYPMLGKLTLDPDLPVADLLVIQAANRTVTTALSFQSVSVSVQ